MNWLLMITVTFENFRQSWQCTCSNYILNYCLSLRNLSKWLKEEKKNQKTKNKASLQEEHYVIISTGNIADS